MGQLRHPLVLGPGSAPPASATPSIKELTAAYSGNTGNLIFAKAGASLLSDSRRAPFRFKNEDLEGRDCIVITAANWLHPSADHSFLADRLEATTLPVFILGLGAQAGMNMEIPALKEGTLRLVKLISERSKLISARGDFTREVLAHYGINNVRATGCPSLLLNGPRKPELRLVERVTPSRTAIHSTRHRFRPCDSLQEHLYRSGIKMNLDIVLQSETADIPYAMGIDHSSLHDEKISEKIIQNVYQDDLGAVKNYLAQHGKIFWCVNEWIEFLRGKDFCIGTRIHGTVAALLSGTPGMLIAHDSRTTELAKKMNIPYVERGDIDISADLDLNSLYDHQKFDKFINGYGEYYRKFIDFFSENELSVDSNFEIPQSGQNL